MKQEARELISTIQLDTLKELYQIIGYDGRYSYPVHNNLLFPMGLFIREIVVIDEYLISKSLRRANNS